MLPSLLSCKSQSLLTSRGISLLGMLCLPAVLCQATTGKGQSPKDTGWTLTLHLICTWSFLLSRGKSVYCNFLPVGKLCLSALVRKRAVPGRWLCWGCASVSPKEACSPCWALALALPFPGQTQQIAARSWGVNPTGSEPGCRMVLSHYTRASLGQGQGCSQFIAQQNCRTSRFFRRDSKDFVGSPISPSPGPKTDSWESREELPWLTSAMGKQWEE